MTGHAWSVVITGASSGLGAALAEAYAAPGVTLGLTARNAERLALVAGRCQAAGARVETWIADIRDARALGAWLVAFDAGAPIDLLIANAGVSPGIAGDGMFEGHEAITDQISVNLLGAVNTIEPVLPAMIKRGRGQIALIGSLAAYRGLPYSPGYCASKAGLRAYGEALRALVAPTGIAVSVVSPGFFDTPMSRRFHGGKLGTISADAAAARVRHGIARRRSRIVFPRSLALLMQLADLIPAPLGDAILRRYRFRIQATEN